MRGLKAGAAKKKKTAKTTDHFRLPIVCDADTLRSLLRKKAVRVVDVRKADDYGKGHVPTAVSLPLARVLENDAPEKVIDILEEIGVTDGMPVVVYDDTFGALAARVAWTFQYVGHTNTALLEMTFKQWKELGLETEKRAHNFPRSEHPLAINAGIHADAKYVESAKSEQGKLLVDSRERLNFLTEHIPGAKNIPYTMVGSNGSILRKADELKRMIENRGISSDSEIITYCGSVGTLSGLTYYALKLAGFSNVKLYPKSFKEWKALGKPKEEFRDATYWDLSAE
ncbi:MAG TPA: rhodanese-like domain-containing protein [Nitrososphaera sp.]|jgi:thiosulfate/3-mercaptopyruvate sulfurtransferase